MDRRPQADMRRTPCRCARFMGAGIVKVGGSRALRKLHRRFRRKLDGARPETLECDLILSAGGHAPAVHLHSQAGGKLRWVEASAMFVPDGAAPGLWSAGACGGIFSRDTAGNHAAEVGDALARRQTPPPAAVGGAGRSLAALMCRASGASNSSICKTM